jgi:hypothetical protein
MVHGSTRVPRRHPRSPKTVRSQLLFVLPTLRCWAQNHESLREINREDILAALPTGGSARLTTLQGQRSVFTVLKARKLTFCNPTAMVRELEKELGPGRGAIARVASQLGVTRSRCGTGSAARRTAVGGRGCWRWSRTTPGLPSWSGKIGSFGGRTRF